MLKAVLFDFDGVLVESVDIKTKAFASLFEDEGNEIVQKIVEYHLKNGGISRFKKFDYIYTFLLGKDIDDKMRNELGLRFSELVLQNVIDAPWVPGARDFLDLFYKSIDLYVVSGTPEDELIKIIDQKDMSTFFKGVYGSPETKGNLIRYILENGPYKKEEVVFVGDAITDLNGAFEAGVSFIGRVFDREKNPFDKYDVPCIINLKQLPEILKTMGFNLIE